jgi:hypothetical protein
MKHALSFILTLAILNLMLVSCERQQKDTPPELPPYESMVIDFSKFTVQEKDAIADLKSTCDTTMNNYQFAAFNVGLFSIIITVTLVVPVAAFYHSFSVEPVFLGDATWQWSCNYNVIGGTYSARLTGQVRASDVKWEMYISKAGIGGFDEFKWYEGTSNLDGTGGQWVLNHSAQFPEPMLQIDWERTGTEVGEVTYTDVRELNNNRTPNANYGSYIEAGRTDADRDAYYNIHLESNGYDVFIEWSTTEYYGRVMAETSYLGPGWHCWDSYGYDIECGE